MPNENEHIEFWSELTDLPAALIKFANGDSPKDLLDTHSDNVVTNGVIESHRLRVQKNLQRLVRRKVDEVGSEMTDALMEGRVSWKSNYVWRGGLILQTEGILGRTSFKLGLDYATALLADLLAHNRMVFLCCARCGNFALLDKRGGGGRDNKKWCSTRCRNLEAKRAFREREKFAK